ncbi:hypothetical protein LINPERHAP1_LOCUS29117 [Linum perenne]
MEISMAMDVLSYSSIVNIATEDLKYVPVERIFYLLAGAAMTSGLRPITNDDEARELLDVVAKVDVGVVHLIDDSDRTTGPEFMEAMENLGLTNRRRRVRTTFDEYGMEVEQLNEVSVNNPSHDVINQEGGLQLNEDDMVIPEVQNTEDVDGERTAFPVVLDFMVSAACTANHPFA